MKNKKTAALSLGILFSLLLTAFTCWASLQPRALDRVKEITMVINHSDDYLESVGTDPETAEPFELTWRTTARTLTEAMAERPELVLTQTAEGYELSEADGEFADNWHGWHWGCYHDKELVPDLASLLIGDGETYYFYLIGEG